jgi:hypothetical protein
MMSVNLAGSLEEGQLSPHFIDRETEVIRSERAYQGHSQGLKDHLWREGRLSLEL